MLRGGSGSSSVTSRSIVAQSRSAIRPTICGTSNVVSSGRAKSESSSASTAGSLSLTIAARAAGHARSASVS
ncbi:hypothetical protein QP162_09595 [Sphingomonas aurantiaca]|uniref:hypothetical protein n=1 Tax=Sphingomonas aurantiaca TaxID=185949 RepID=UPI002FDF168E